MSVNIIEFPASDEQLRIIHGLLVDKFSAAVKARQNQLDGNYKRWMDNYNAKPYEAVRSTPFYRASNFVPQLIRMHTDILHARTWGICIGTRPFWKCKMLPEGPHEMLDSLNDQMETWSHNANLYSALDSGLLRAFKTGVVTLKGPWVEDEYYLGVSAKDSKGQSAKKISKEGVQFRPLPFDDFYPYPITANSLKEVTMKFHRIRLSKEEVEYRMHRGWWNETAGKILLAGANSVASSPGKDARESQSNEAGIALSIDVDRPFTAIECWYDYELQNGKIYKLVTTFNPFLGASKEGLLRRHYNYYSTGIDPFVDLRPMPREDLYYGYNIPEMLEQSQEEQAQVHNSRRDSNSMTIPGWKKKRYADVPNPSTEWYPGKCFELDDMADLEMITPSVQYNAMIDEERHIMSLAETYTGAGQPLQAAGSGIMQGKRGIYNSGGTLALLAEGNRRLDIYIKRMRGEINSPTGFHGLGNLLYQSNKGFRPDGPEYKVSGERGQALQKIFALDEDKAGYDGLFFEAAASDAGANRETERTSLLLMANTMAAYYKQVVEIAGVVGQMQGDNPIKSTMLMVLDGARDLANRLLFSFDVPDRKRLVPDIRKVLEGGAGGPQGQPGTPEPAQPGGMQDSPGSLSEPNLQDLSARLATLTGGSNGAPGNGGRSAQVI